MEHKKLFLDAKKRQMMADYLKGKAVSPLKLPTTGAVMPQYGIGHGLVDLAEAFVARKAGQKADESYGAAVNSKNKAMADALLGLSGPMNDPYAASQAAIDAGVDPSVVREFMVQQRPEDPEPLVSIMTQEGPRLVPRSQAEGQEPFNAMTAKGSGPVVGTYNPRDYTPESFAEFTKSKDPAVLRRYERLGEFDLGGGRKGFYDRVTGQPLGESVSGETYNENRRSSNAAGAQGTSQGNAITQAQLNLAQVKTLAGQLETMMADPDFDGAVGPVDNVTGRVGQMFGSDEGTLGGQAGRLANQLVAQAATAWKGAISDRELELFMDSAPGRGSSATTWRKWYLEEFKPRLAEVERVAAGGAFAPSEQAELSIEELVQKYGGS